jgi:hypothetical protein
MLKLKVSTCGVVDYRSVNLFLSETRDDYFTTLYNNYTGLMDIAVEALFPIPVMYSTSLRRFNGVGDAVPTTPAMLAHVRAGVSRVKLNEIFKHALSLMSGVLTPLSLVERVWSNAVWLEFPEYERRLEPHVSQRVVLFANYVNQLITEQLCS